MWLAIFICVAAATLWLASWMVHKARQTCGPMPLPFLGNLLNYAFAGNGHMKVVLSMMHQYGKTFQAFLPGLPLGMRLLFVHRPEHIKHILSDAFKQGKYGKGDFLRGAYYDFLGDGIFNVNGHMWEQQRHTASYLFRTPNLKHHMSVFQRQAAKLVAKLKLDSRGGTEVLDMQDFFLRYTLDSFAEIGFGVQLDAISQSHNDFQVAFDYVQTAAEGRTRLGAFWPILEWLLPDRAFHANLAYLNSTTEQIIQQRKSEPLEKLQQRPDLLSQLIAERNTDDSGGPTNNSNECRFSAKYLRDFVMNFMIAGRDTTATLLTWTTYLLAQHPNVEERVLREMDEVLGPDGEISWQALKELTYMKQVLQEALRLYPPVPLEGFTAFEDDVLPGGIPVQKGDMVVYCPYTVHRQEDIYPEPERFDPDRFANAPQPYTFVPFHGGPRQCLGMDMAYLEAKVMMCTFLRAFRARIAPGFVVEPKAALILTTKSGLRMNLMPRSESQ